MSILTTCIARRQCHVNSLSIPTRSTIPLHGRMIRNMFINHPTTWCVNSVGARSPTLPALPQQPRQHPYSTAIPPPSTDINSTDTVSVNPTSSPKLETTLNKPPIQDPCIQLLESCSVYYTNPGSGQVSSTPPNSWRFSYLASGTTKALELCTRTQLHSKSGKNVILSCPHPGSVLYLEHIGHHVAKRVGATFVSLDYQTLMRLALSCTLPIPHTSVVSAKEKGISTTTSIHGDPVVLADSFPLSPSFAVDAWEAEDSMRAEEEGDEEGEEDDEDFGSSSSSSSSGSSAVSISPSTIARMAHLFGKARGTSSLPLLPVSFSLQVNRQEPGSSAASSERSVSSSDSNSSTVYRLEAGRVGNPPSTDLPFAKSSSYNYTISGEQIQFITSALGKFISLQSSSPCILYIKDMTDILEAGGAEGRKLVASLINFVSLAQNQGHQILLMAGCTPALSDPDGLCYNWEHYRSVFDLEASNFMWEEGRFFQTPLDFLTSRFTKFDIFPPSPALYNNTVRAASIFDAWLKDMQRDQKARVAQLNWNACQLLAHRRGILGPAAVGNYVALPLILPSSLSTFLSNSVFRKSEIERWVDFSYGQYLTEGVPSAMNVTHFTIGLKLLMSQSLARFVSKSSGSGSGGGGSASEKESNIIAPAQPAPMKARQQPLENAKMTTDKAATPASTAELLRSLSGKLNAHEKKLLSTVVNPDIIKTTFSDLVLPSSSKLLLQTLITLPLKRPEFFAKGVLAKHSINGCLLFGPPGTGKTMLAKAIAKSSGARFMNVALSDIFDKYVGEGEKNVKAIFTLARKISPCIVFLDEVDAAFSSRRGDGLNSSKREIINEFMSEWDGLQSNNNGVIIMGATNRPFDLDDAILRRMPRRVLIDMPNLEQRKQIIRLCLNDEELDPLLDLDTLAAKTVSYSGSDLKNLCVAAAFARVKEVIVRESMLADALTVSVSDEKMADVIVPTPEAIAERISKLEDWDGVAVKKEVKVQPSLEATDNDDVANVDAITAKATDIDTENGGASSSQSTTVMPADPSIDPLAWRHFEVALREVPPSLTDETLTMAELKKWDAMYGDGAGSRKQTRPGWGFATPESSPSSLPPSSLAKQSR